MYHLSRQFQSLRLKYKQQDVINIYPNQVTEETKYLKEVLRKSESLRDSLHEFDTLVALSYRTGIEIYSRPSTQLKLKAVITSFNVDFTTFLPMCLSLKFLGVYSTKTAIIIFIASVD